MKIRIIKEIHLGMAGKIQAGVELYGRIVQVDPLCKMFQCTFGEHSGKEIPFKYYAEIPEEKTFAELRVIELEQENLMRLEDVKILESKLDKAIRYGQDANALGLRSQNELIVAEGDVKDLRQKVKDLNVGIYRKHESLLKSLGEVSRLNALYQAEKESRIYHEAALERAMLDHQPVVLLKRQIDAINFFKNPPKGIYTNWSNYSIIDCVLNKGKYSDCYEPPLSALREIEFDLLLQALVNDYTVEETVEDKVLNYFETVTPKDWKFSGDGNDPVYIARDAIRTTCSMLGKEIEGITSKN